MLLTCYLDCDSSMAIRCLAHFLTTKSKKKAVDSNADVPFLIMEVQVNISNLLMGMCYEYVFTAWYTCTRGCGHL